MRPHKHQHCMQTTKMQTGSILLFKLCDKYCCRCQYRCKIFKLSPGWFARRKSSCWLAEMYSTAILTPTLCARQALNSAICDGATSHWEKSMPIVQLCNGKPNIKGFWSSRITICFKILILETRAAFWFL